MENKNIIIFLGPPGSGKGTQAELVKKKYQYKIFPMGDALRKAAEKKTLAGRKLKECLDKGIIIFTAEMALVVENFLKKNLNKNIIFDGFPRLLTQGRFLINFFQKNNNFWQKKIFYFRLTNNLVIERIKERRVCEKCRRVYHLKYKKPKKRGICDFCGGRLVKRTDAKNSVIKDRIKNFKEQTLPLVRFFKEKKDWQVFEIDVKSSIEIVFKKIEKFL